ncbi:(R)-mandelonitrile lyase [Jiella pelagia]|uniref:Cupin domain-containing protein n=1 Tax=Jiella pelagia TaxID=2986949 RepID=A0ABY7C5F5_9HYPH|nr:cupin domain-containing protein [Jiella pelagia]WAP71169.1 cupin domain-containing protein [Jiella pelagia]
MDIKRIGETPSDKGPEDHLTGRVRLDPLISPPEPARVAMAKVTFEPGARTAGHTHPPQQTLIVTEGCGWARREGGPKETIRSGDVVWFIPHERHWHGATASIGMTRIAVQEREDGSTVDWLEQVSQEDYQAGVGNGVAHRTPSSFAPLRPRRCLLAIG